MAKGTRSKNVQEMEVWIKFEDREVTTVELKRDNPNVNHVIKAAAQLYLYTPGNVIACLGSDKLKPGQEITPMLKNVTPKNPILIKLIVQPQPIQEPKPVNFPVDARPSNASLQSLYASGTCDNVPIYSHSFALELYNIYNTKHDGEVFSYHLNGCDISVMSASIHCLYKQFQSIGTLPISTTKCRVGVRSCEAKVQRHELTQTALLATELDRFFFANNPQCNVMCLHQLPVYCQKQGRPESPDFYIVSIDDNHLPYFPVLLSDYKFNDFGEARRETIAYVQRVLQQSNKYFGVCLGLPITAMNATLLICVGLHKKMLVIDLFPEKPLNLQQQQVFKKFFALLYGAVTSLAAKPFAYFWPDVIQIFSPPKYPFKLNASPGTQRVFIQDGMVYKLFDQHDRRISPNMNVIQCIADNYLPGIQLVDLTEDQRFQCLQYRCLIGSHDPKSHQQFLTLLCDLEKLHSAGFVHGDIRRSNLIFDKDDDKKAWMIDFDLAGKEGTLYPSAYNHVNIQERHTSARAGEPRNKAHDLFAIKTIFETTLGPLPLTADFSLDDVKHLIKKFNAK